MSKKRTVGVVGGGSFGQGIAQAAARKDHQVVLFTRKRDLSLGDRVKVTEELAEVAQAKLIFVATPSEHVRAIAEQLGDLTDGSHALVHVSRGLVDAELRPITAILRTATPCRRLGALAGPLLAEDLLEGRASGTIIGTHFPEVAQGVRDALASPSLRIYETTDLVGVQIASAMVGMLAVLLGYARETGAAPAALAVLATRGMSELARIGQTMGAQESTFMGLAGFGDLIAAVAGDNRPELLLGAELAKGLQLETAVANAGAHVEGIQMARRLIGHAERVGAEVPISRAFVQVVDGKLSQQDAAAALMARRMGKG